MARSEAKGRDAFTRTVTSPGVGTGRILRPGNLAKRGVWIAPWLGDAGEMILVSVRHDRRRVEERPIPPGSNSIDIGDEMWDRLDREDPMGLRLVAT